MFVQDALPDALPDFALLVFMFISSKQVGFGNPFQNPVDAKMQPEINMWRQSSFETVIWQSFVSRLGSEEPFGELPGAIFAALNQHRSK